MIGARFGGAVKLRLRDRLRLVFGRGYVGVQVEVSFKSANRAKSGKTVGVGVAPLSVREMRRRREEAEK